MTARSVRYAVCEAMGSAIPEGFRPEMPSRASSAARADIAEGVAVDTVAADPSVFDTDAAPAYRDRVESHGRCCNCSATIARNPDGFWPFTCPSCGVRGVCIDYLREGTEYSFVVYKMGEGWLESRYPIRGVDAA